jgi:hypothetical protein
MDAGGLRHGGFDIGRGANLVGIRFTAVSRVGRLLASIPKANGRTSDSVPSVSNSPVSSRNSK